MVGCVSKFSLSKLSTARLVSKLWCLGSVSVQVILFWISHCRSAFSTICVSRAVHVRDVFGFGVYINRFFGFMRLSIQDRGQIATSIFLRRLDALDRAQGQSNRVEWKPFCSMLYALLVKETSGFEYAIIALEIKITLYACEVPSGNVIKTECSTDDR